MPQGCSANGYVCVSGKLGNQERNVRNKIHFSHGVNDLSFSYVLRDVLGDISRC